MLSFEQRMQKRRQQEQRDQEVKRSLKQNHLFTDYAARDQKIAQRRQNQRIRAYQQDFEMQQRFEQQQKQRVAQEKLAQQEEAIAQKIAERKQKQLYDEKMTQKIRDESHELRDLEARLKHAYIALERETQLKEKEQLRLKAQNEEQRIASQMNAELEKTNRRLAEKEAYQREQNLLGRQYLEKQIRDKEREKELQYQEYLKEKEEVDRIAAKILEEEKKVQDEINMKRHQTKAEIDQFLQQKHDLQLIETEKLRKEEEAIKRYAELVEKRNADRKAKEDAIKAEKYAIFQAQTKNLDQERKKKEEMEYYLNLLHEEEQKEKNRQKELEILRKRSQMRDEMMEANRLQQQYKAEQKRKEQEEEAKFERMMMEKFQEDERIARLTAQRRRQQMIQFKEDVKNMLDMRRQMLDLEREREAREESLAKQKQDQRAIIIEQERQKLIKEHAAKIIKYLPKGVLKAKDMELLPPEVREEVKRQQDPFQVYQFKKVTRAKRPTSIFP